MRSFLQACSHNCSKNTLGVRFRTIGLQTPLTTDFLPYQRVALFGKPAAVYKLGRIAPINAVNFYLLVYLSSLGCFFRPYYIALAPIPLMKPSRFSERTICAWFFNGKQFLNVHFCSA